MQENNIIYRIGSMYTKVHIFDALMNNQYKLFPYNKSSQF